MITQEKVTALDLNISVPRSSKDTLAGLVHLPRMIDKARALRNGTLGEYIYPCPLDRHLLNFLDITGEDFADLAEGTVDEDLAVWAGGISRHRAQREREFLKSQIVDRKPDASTIEDFLKQRNQIDPDRTDVVTWADLRDLEEGHI